MTGAEIDAENRRARVSAAAKRRDVSALTSPRGLAPLSGLSAEVDPPRLFDSFDARARVPDLSIACVSTDAAMGLTIPPSHGVRMTSWVR